MVSIFLSFSSNIILKWLSYEKSSWLCVEFIIVISLSFKILNINFREETSKFDVDSSSNDNNKVRFRTEFPVSQFDYNTSRTRSQNQKVAFVISGTTAKAFCNGSLVKTFTITETTMEQLNYRVQNGKFRTKQLLMLPTALTDQEAIDLTTI